MTTLITAIYNHGPSSIFGGRGRHVHFFNPSLRNINNLDLPIVIYTDSANAGVVEGLVSRYMTKYKIIPYELEKFEYSREVLDHKHRILDTIELNDRNHILCLNKPYWLKDGAEKNYFNTDKFLWVDSGLTHHGIIPEKVGGVELLTNIPDEHYYPLNPNNIFTPKLGRNLNNSISRDKIFACSLPLQGGDTFYRKALKDVLDLEVAFISNHLIGGIFGGYADTIFDFYQKYHIFMKYCVDNEILILEEPLFSCMYAAYPELFNLQHFYTWYFYSPGERTHMLNSEADSFYKIFQRISEL